MVTLEVGQDSVSSDRDNSRDLRNSCNIQQCVLGSRSCISYHD